MKAAMSQPMQLVYSAIKPISKTKNNVRNDIPFLAYKIACEKYSDEIEAIQKYFPGWMPDPPSFCSQTRNKPIKIKKNKN